MSAVRALRARLPREPGGRIAWRQMSDAELTEVCELADRFGDISVLAGARRALRRADDVVPCAERTMP